MIGRRRLDPHLDAFRALGATVEHGRDIAINAPDGGLRPCDFFMDEPSVMGTENALMAAAGDRGHHGHPQRRVRAARAGPRADAQQDGRGDRGHRLQRHARARRRHARRLRAHRHPRPHRDRLVHGARGRDRRRAADHGLRRRGPADDPDGLPPPRAGLAMEDGDLLRPRRPDAARRARRRRLPVQGRGRPVAGLPGRPHVDRRRARHPVRGLGPDLREDVREPAVLRGQADLDGRRDHDLRPAPGDRDRPAPAARRARLLARTSAPAWRC